MIVALSGYAKSGKNTVAEMMQQKQPEKNWQIKGFSHKLKQVASVLTGYSVESFESQEFKENFLTPWSMTVRQFLQRLGTEAIRNGLHKDAWVNALMSEYKAGDNWIIVDCRFPNEAEAVERVRGLIVRIDRGSPVNNHPSETSLDKYDFDFFIRNNGDMDQLSSQVDAMINIKL